MSVESLEITVHSSRKTRSTRYSGQAPSISFKSMHITRRLELHSCAYIVKAQLKILSNRQIHLTQLNISTQQPLTKISRPNSYNLSY
ncbi:hypothetical protein BT93_I0860 [Corymbia citriodora subsp. variegata]|nr:hypothetical protein BT93_I0860 [Corymbia citriodora subsp. variegata]